VSDDLASIGTVNAAAAQRADAVGVEYACGVLFAGERPCRGCPGSLAGLRQTTSRLGTSALLGITCAPRVGRETGDAAGFHSRSLTGRLPPLSLGHGKAETYARNCRAKYREVKPLLSIMRIHRELTPDRPDDCIEMTLGKFAEQVKEAEKLFSDDCELTERYKYFAKMPADCSATKAKPAITGR
jgi:hypothetical protein